VTAQDTNHGPFDDEQQARETPAVQAVYAAFDAGPGVGKMRPHNLAMLEEACTAAGVEVSAYDHKILLWLSGWEPETCAVVAGLIRRAHQAAAASPYAGQRTALADHIERRLEDEYADRQGLCELAVLQLRKLARGTGPPARARARR